MKWVAAAVFYVVKVIGLFWGVQVFTRLKLAKLRVVREYELILSVSLKKAPLLKWFTLRDAIRVDDEVKLVVELVVLDPEQVCIRSYDIINP